MKNDLSWRLWDLIQKGHEHKLAAMFAPIALLLALIVMGPHL